VTQVDTSLVRSRHVANAEKPQLFLLQPSFEDPKVGPGVFHCPHCARIEGLLSFFPFLRTRLDVHHVDFGRPRTAIVDLLGPENQSCPVLVLASGEEFVGAQRASTGRAFISTALGISEYLAQRHGISLVHP
jgi:hypothetical protein